MPLRQFTKFQKRVYRTILDIPLGETRSYKWVAKKIGKPKAVRAVGTALRNNPFTVIIPCHRVISNDGSLGGYSKGIKKKKRLLELEKKIKLSLSFWGFRYRC
jgi:methylated-DNA-[protein]-cysteine S-methyltransferase